MYFTFLKNIYSIFTLVWIFTRMYAKLVVKPLPMVFLTITIICDKYVKLTHIHNIQAKQTKNSLVKLNKFKT